MALLLLRQALRGIKLAYLESRVLKSTRNPFISKWCEDLKFMMEKKEKGGKLWGDLCILQIQCVVDS